MKYHELQVSKHRAGMRVGRGISAGKGKTAGRGTKGQKARTGSTKRPGFTGGQNPLMQQLPKLPGFRSFRAKAENVFTDQLENLGATVTNETLAAKGLISSPYVRVKLLHRGTLAKKVSVSLQAASESAIETVQQAGGSFTVVDRPSRPKTANKPADKKA
ncbi:MAG TPA: 50S ribosomal protein L15 [Candidatus Saccharimonadales bacterium]